MGAALTSKTSLFWCCVDGDIARARHCVPAKYAELFLRLKESLPFQKQAPSHMVVTNTDRGSTDVQTDSSYALTGSVRPKILRLPAYSRLAGRPCGGIKFVWQKHQRPAAAAVRGRKLGAVFTLCGRSLSFQIFYRSDDRETRLLAYRVNRVRKKDPT